MSNAARYRVSLWLWLGVLVLLAALVLVELDGVVPVLAAFIIGTWCGDANAGALAAMDREGNE